MLRSGQVVEKYVVEAVLGSGGFSEVYRVRHQQLRSVHALKVLAAVDGPQRERLMEEGRVQATLRHPNLVGVTDVLQLEGRPALVMEYVNGPSLRAWMDQSGVPVPARAVELARGIARGLRYAHERGLIHRDLKPENILLEVSAQGIVPRVLDFGLVKRRAIADAEPGVTLGTPSYMAPEQIRDPSAVDERADVFSLGCVLYELAHGLPPFDGATPSEVVREIQAGRRRPVSQDLPPALQALIDRMLSHDPADRLPSARDAVAALSEPELLRTQPVAQHPARAMSSMEARSPVRPPRTGGVWLGSVIPLAGFVVGCLVVAVAGGGTAGDGGLPDRADAEPPFVAVPVDAPRGAPQPPPPAPVSPAPVSPDVEATPEGGAGTSTGSTGGAAGSPPTPSPAPVPPVAAPTNPTPAEVGPAPTEAPRTGIVRVSGDARSVTLVRGSTRVTRLESVPSGRWTIRAEFGSGEVDAGEVTVEAGGTVDVRCVAFALRCK